MYAYVHNNPFLYTDPEGRWYYSFAFPVLDFTFGLAGFVCPPLALAILTGVAICSTAYVVNGYVQDCRMKNAMLANNHEPQAENVEENVPKETENKGRRAGRDNEIKGGPSRDPKIADYLPDPLAEGSPHTTLGTRQGKYEDYTQGATFNGQGKFEGRTDVTNHGRGDHPPVH
jgi:hypothetical protein